MLKPALIAGMLVTAVVTPAMVMPPLTQPESARSVGALSSHMGLSATGAMGYDHFARNCVACHGPDPLEIRNSEALVHEIGRWNAVDRRAFRELSGPNLDRWSKGPDIHAELSFNEIELIARFVRDVQRWQTRMRETF